MIHHHSGPVRGFTELLAHQGVLRIRWFLLLFPPSHVEFLCVFPGRPGHQLPHTSRTSELKETLLNPTFSKLPLPNVAF